MMIVGPLLAATLVIGGSPDTAHPSVVSVVSRPAAGSATFCSGVVVAPRVVLTAGHCVFGALASEVAVSVGADASAPDRTLAAQAVYVFPEFGGSSEDQRAGLDLAAVVVGEDLAVPALAYARTAVEALVGSSATVVGFGLTDPLDLDSAGQRQSAPVPITAACDRLVAFGDDERRACDGDSGAALLVPDGAGGELVVALVSFGIRTTCRPPSYAVRTDVYAAWIDAVVAGAPDSSCASTCPPPGTTCFAPDAGLGADAGAGDDRDGCACGVGRGRARPGFLGLVVFAIAAVSVLRQRDSR